MKIEQVSKRLQVKAREAGQRTFRKAAMHVAPVPAAAEWQPFRIDFAGGWLDVPRLAVGGAYIVNCAITPGLRAGQPSPFRYGGGVGGSAAEALLSGRDALAEELSRAGWQDPAIIAETGWCAWHSGPRPVLALKRNPDLLRGKMALLWTGKPHCTGDLVCNERPYPAIVKAGELAYRALCESALGKLADAVMMTHTAQCEEGMEPLEVWPMALARKYAGSGFGGYALYLFADQEYRADWATAMRARGREVVEVEPYVRPPLEMVDVV